MKGEYLRVGLVAAIIFGAEFLMRRFAESNDVLMFSLIFVLALFMVSVVIKMLGPTQKADERMVKRSEEAALMSVRVSLLAGAVGSAYADLLGMEKAVPFLLGMVVPGVIWVALYFILNLRDVR